MEAIGSLEKTYNSIHIRKYLYANIVFNGDSTVFPGVNRIDMSKEITGFAPSSPKIEVVAPSTTTG